LERVVDYPIFFIKRSVTRGDFVRVMLTTFSCTCNQGYWKRSIDVGNRLSVRDWIIPPTGFSILHLRDYQVRTWGSFHLVAAVHT